MLLTVINLFEANTTGNHKIIFILYNLNIRKKYVFRIAKLIKYLLIFG